MSTNVHPLSYPAPCFALDPGIKLGLEKIAVLAEQYESGAASSPFSNRCRNLLDPASAKPLRILVLAICEGSRQAALHVLLGKDLSEQLSRLATTPGIEFLELHFQTSGFSVDNGLQRQDFDTQESMFNCLRTIQPRTGNHPQYLKIGISLPSWQHGPNLTIAGKFEQLIGSPDLIANFSGTGDILLLAGMDDSPYPANGAEVLELLCHGIPVAQAQIIRKDSPEAVSHPAWMKLLQSAVMAPPCEVILTEDGASSAVPKHSILTENLSRLRPLLGNLRIAREATSIAATLSQQARAETERVVERRRMTEIPAVTTSDPGFRGISDYVATNLQSDVASLTRHIEDGIRDSLLPGGKLFQLVKKIADSLDANQLTQSLLPKTTRFEAGEDLCRSLRKELLNQLAVDMAEQKAFLEDALSASAEMLAGKLTETTGSPGEFKLPQHQTDRLLSFATSLASAPLQLRTEIPRTTGTQFAWTCFQNPTMILMSITMPLSMFLSSPDVGPILRKFKFDVALYGLVPFFLFTPFYLHRKLRKEAEFNLEREMERLRNTLQTDLERMARTVSDERRKTAIEWFKSASDDIRKQAAAILGDTSKLDEKRRSDEKQSQMATLQRLDGRLRELGLSAQQSDQIRDQLEKDVRQTLSTITSVLVTPSRS